MLTSPATRDRILAAARDRFDREGLAGVSMRKIAQDVGVTPMAIYRHYTGKDALVDALMLDGLAAWEDRARAVEADDPLTWLARFFTAFLDFAITEPRRYEAAFLLPAGRARRYPDDFIAGRSPAINLAHARIDAAKAAGLIGDTPTAQIALALSALGQGLVSMHRAGRFVGEEQFRAAYETALRHCLGSFMGKGRP